RTRATQEMKDSFAALTRGWVARSSRAMTSVGALALTLFGQAHAADPMAAFDEFSVKSAIISKCHLSQSAADRAYLAKREAVKRAAATALKAKLDTSDSAHKTENAKKAEDELEHQLAARSFDIDEQIRNYGCQWLDGQLYTSGHD
ncbi:MAG TPA: hypothetical protein VET85_16660, partial [Stellaceae bacterium]|nr:hypothetical protein [Stellaceae bacterium]